jgi:hypothetical protein
VKDWEILADTLHKAGWSLGWSQLWILKGERFGLLTRMGTGSVLLCVADEKADCVYGTAEGDSRVRGEFDVVVTAQKRERDYKPLS